MPDSPYSRPVVLQGADEGPAFRAANVEAINRQFAVINENFQGIDRLFEELRYNVRAAINADVNKLRDEIKKEFDIKKMCDQINKEFATKIAQLRVETYKTINENIAGADKATFEFGLNVRKMVDESFDTIRKELSVDALRREFTNEIASLRADIAIQVASLHADIATKRK